MFNNWYAKEYEKLLDIKDALDDHLETLDDDSKEYREINDLVLDILDIDYYIQQALEKSEKYKNIIKNYQN